MSEDNESFGSIFASGIQDVAAVLGILGTEMCDGNAALTLSKGYLFPAACSTSMFGVLGLSKYLLKSFLPELVVENMGINRSEFDKYKVKEKVELKVRDISNEKLDWLIRHDVKIYLHVIGLNGIWWILSLASCFGLSCLNFVPYIPHYYRTPSLDYIYFPLLLTSSSFVASFVCCVDSVLMLSGHIQFYNVTRFVEPPLIPHHFGNRYIMLVTSLIGCISALGIVIGYLGSYLVVKQMTEVNTYLWLGLELVLCFLRLVVWSVNTDKDDLKYISLKFKMDRTDEKVIEAFQKEFGISQEKAEDMLERIKGGVVLNEDEMEIIQLDENYIENFDWMDLKGINKIDACYFQMISEEENTWYFDEELDLQPGNKHDIVEADFTHITYVYKRAREWLENFEYYLCKEGEEEDQVYDVINL
ncbi:hypothetical protein G6F43_005285 [Rhizopus delemar]|nr:hypothetical protein G6F43_005285 [Rhizopus delemar]